MDYVDQDEDDLDEGPEIEMNWNLATYLPEGGAIQKNFNTVIAGYITANYQFIEEEAQRIAPGHTPIRKRRSSQSQTPNRRLSQATGEIFVLQYLVHDIKPPNNQSCFPQFFLRFFSVLAFEKENKLFIGPKKIVLDQEMVFCYQNCSDRL